MSKDVYLWINVYINKCIFNKYIFNKYNNNNQQV